MGLKIELRNWKEFLEKFNFPSLEKWPQRAITHLDYFFTNYIVITIFFVIIVSLQDPICLLTPIPVIFIISTLYFLEKENVFKFENSKIRILIYCLAIILISGFFLLIVAEFY
ncbi:pra1 protein [Anaeramoeba ignava]|uniref:PRA1 family protein n=1 Tax=Anaeramoeba ignava TaxID=1746090 RepID=A0A9Q0R5N4_ANAIG|nr:pra1 protein [Anaeramoeba ignava]